MKYQTQCLITGCYFLDEDEKRWIKGDLHQLFDILIVNTLPLKWRWFDDAGVHQPDAKDKMIKAEFWYEKGGQIVFPLGVAQFNLAANAFLNQYLDTEEGAKSIILHAKLKGH